MARFIFAAGGTGGHIMPALAIAEALLEENPTHQILFLGTGRELEKQLIDRGRQALNTSGISYHAVPAAAITGKGFAGVLRFLAALPKAVRTVRGIFREFRPDVVCGFGGYPSFLPTAVAKFSRIPTALQEQNGKVGLANKAVALLVSRVFAVPHARGWWLPPRKLVAVENPVRKCFYSVGPYQLPNRDAGASFRILVLGGSQGAQRVNQAVLELVPLFREFQVELVHQSGSRDLEDLRRGYESANYVPHELAAFFPDVEKQYAAASVIICRAGAMTAAEVSATKRPAVYIPLPIAGGHQAENVRGLVERGAARLVPEGDGFIERLRAELRNLLEDPSQLRVMSDRLAAQESKERPAQIIAEGLLKLKGNRNV